MGFYGFRPYVPVAQRRLGGAEGGGEAQEKGRVVSPVAIEGRKIAQSFWGKAWCDNLERYSDFENRLPRGRTYVRNGSVIDLQIERGKVEALVSGSEIYKVEIDIAVAAPARWTAICRDCAGSVGSLIELLQGKLSKNVMERVCREADGLFPAPGEIEMSCSCPDWADMCKHVAATLYGVGARLDSDPDLLFTLRGVDRAELVSVGADLPLTRGAAASERVLEATTSRRCSASTSPRPTRRPRSRRRSKASRRKDWRAPEPRRPLCFRRRSRTRQGSRRAPLRTRRRARRRAKGSARAPIAAQAAAPAKAARPTKPPRARRQKSQRSRRASRNQAPPTRGPDE